MSDERVPRDSLGTGREGVGEAVRASDSGPHLSAGAEAILTTQELPGPDRPPDRRARMSGIVVVIDEVDGVPRKYELDATLTEMP